MRKFWDEYVDLCKKSVGFYKKHWFGVLVMNLVSVAGTFAWLYRDEIKDRVESKIKKEES